MPKLTLSLLTDEQNLHQDKVQQILNTLKQLAETAPTPVIRVCLEEARQDIAHLAAAGDEYREHATTSQSLAA
jgi:hypothetical protein